MIPAIKKGLSLHAETEIVSESANRENILYIAKEAPTSIPDTFHWIVDELRRDGHKSRKFIIYCRSVKAVGRLFRYFMEELGDSIYVGTKFSGNRLVAMYHHSTHKRIKKLVASSFGKVDSKIRVVIATVAFGMGIDCPDISVVINWGASRSFEGFYQESGRAGRDCTIKSYSIVYFHKSDVTQIATDDRMRDYCHGQDSGKTLPADTGDASDSDDSLEDLFGSVRVCSEKIQPAQEDLICRRKLICQHLTPNNPFVPHTSLHSCCDLCHERCTCGECPPLLGVDLSHLSDDTITTADRLGFPVREVTQEQRDLLHAALESVRDASAQASGLFAGHISSGLDEKTVSQIVADVHHLHQEEDLYTYLYDADHILQVMAVINDIVD
jgi:hypothetical protein